MNINGVSNYSFMQRTVKIGYPNNDIMKCLYCPYKRSRHASRLRVICNETFEDITDIYETGVGKDCPLEKVKEG